MYFPPQQSWVGLINLTMATEQAEMINLNRDRAYTNSGENIYFNTKDIAGPASRRSEPG